MISIIRNPVVQKCTLIILLFFITVVLAEVITKGGILVPFALIGMPFGFFVLYLVLSQPRYGILVSFAVAFIVNGLGRYVTAPFGLALDGVLLLTLFATILSSPPSAWGRVKSMVVLLTFIWFLFTVFEIFNPEAHSFEAWFYAVRGISLYMIILIPLIFLIFHTEKDFDLMITIWFIGSIISSFYGMKQLHIGLNAAENAWLAAGAAEQHILFGRLRVFSFYSDAGQFGAFMAFTALVATILAVRKTETKRRIFYAFTALVCFYGMAISGTRGALFVPLSGSFVYLFMSKNFKTLILGSVVVGVLFFILKFTFIGQGNYQVQRMRSALDPQDPSFQVRLENQRKFREYLSRRPIGGGIGTAGYWGNRFSPGTFLAETPTDSHYVRIWAETGIVGLIVHVGVLLSILAISFFRIFRMEDLDLKQKAMAIHAGCSGIIVASYGNQVMGQMPTNVFFYICLAFLFILPSLEKSTNTNSLPANIP